MKRMFDMTFTDFQYAPQFIPVNTKYTPDEWREWHQQQQGMRPGNYGIVGIGALGKKERAISKRQFKAVTMKLLPCGQDFQACGGNRRNRGVRLRTPCEGS